MNLSSAITRLALLQCVVVVIGVLTTCGSLKIYGYGIDTSLRWNPVSVTVSNIGVLLLLLPAIWVIACLVLERRAHTHWSRNWSIVSGVILISVLIGLFWWTTVTPYFYYKTPIQAW